MLAVTLVAALALAPAAGAAKVEDGIVVESFDETPIVATLILPDSASAEAPVPAVLITHGWGGSRSRSADGFIGRLIDEGYAVLTWDQRGFGESGGVVQVDDPDVEAKDVSALIDFLAEDPRIAREAAGDPLIGMSGGSYGGGVQFVTAATDHRVDAIAPEIAWNNLLESLIPDGAVKDGWGSLLYAVGQTSVTGGLAPTNPAGPQTGNYPPEIHQALAEGAGTGTFSPDIREFFASKGPDFLLGQIEAPTFIIQATTDVLFPPSQAIDNYLTLEQQAPATPLKMAWYCGGHGTCAPFTSNNDHVRDRVVAWFDRYVKGDESSATGPRFEYLTEDGVWHEAADFPVPGTSTRSGTGSGVVVANGEPVASGIFPGSSAATSLKVPIPGKGGTLIGEPTVRMTASGLGLTTDEGEHVTLFFQLVNTTKGHVLGHQVTPKRIATDGEAHTYEFAIDAVSYTLDPGDSLALEVAGTAAGYEANRGGGVVQIEQLDVDVPVRE